MQLKQRLVVTILTIVGSLGSTLHADEPMRCMAGPITESTLEVVRKSRAQAFEQCLMCEGESCRLRWWDVFQQREAMFCHTLFCAPISVGRSAFVPEEMSGEGEFTFSYSIDKGGRAKDIEIIEFAGDVKEKDVKKLARNMYKRRKFEPIVIDGTAYELTNLMDGVRFTLE